MTRHAESLGAIYQGDGSTRFTVWALHAERVELELLSPDRTIPLVKGERGYFSAHVRDVAPGRRYYYRLDGGDPRPDPASRYQPRGVDGPSQVVDRFFDWRDADWFGLPLDEYILYEIHVGTYTAEGTFDAIIPHLEELVRLGVTAIELMPIGQFPGERNWGYDGVLPFAAQNTYGGPEGLKRLVNAAHRAGVAVLLDVIYNHFGPQGNYFPEFGPYLTDRYKTPWGPAMNFDGPWSDEVRRFYIENAIMWAREFHIDGLRLDAGDHIYDFSARPFLAELAEEFDLLNGHLPRKPMLMIETDVNSTRFVRSLDQEGYGIDAQWTDDFHHALFTLLTGDYTSYYIDFKPDVSDPLAHLARVLRDGYVYTGQYSEFRDQRRGVSARSIPAYRQIVFAQNHDQVGNRKEGDRFGALMSFDACKLAAGVVLLSPYLPLLFMGEEYGEEHPFLYFADFEDEKLVNAIKEGRRGYFGSHWQGEPPDPMAIETFERSKLDHGEKSRGAHKRLDEFYRALIGIRKTIPALRSSGKDRQEVSVLSDQLLQVRRWSDDSQVATVFNISDRPACLAPAIPSGRWSLLLDSADPRWREEGEGADEAGETRPQELTAPSQTQLALPPWSFVVYQKR